MCLIDIMEKIEIGTVVGAMGLKGELKIKNYSDQPDRFETLETVLIGDRPHRITGVRYKGEQVILRTAEVTDRTRAEELRGSGVWIYEDQLDELEEGDYYIRDLIGAAVVDEAGEPVGVLREIMPRPGQDIYRVEREGGRDILIPGVEEFIRAVDAENKIIVVRMMEGLADL